MRGTRREFVAVAEGSEDYYCTTVARIIISRRPRREEQEAVNTREEEGQKEQQQQRAINSQLHSTCSSHCFRQAVLPRAEPSSLL
jgi:hypothetical protein